MKSILVVLFVCFAGLSFGQNQFKFSEIRPDKEYENIYVKPLATSEFSSSYLIWVKKSVKAHKHNAHTEHVYILEGKGSFYLDGKTIPVEAGDYLYIPKGAVHAVKVISVTPMKVLSVQSPKFEGKDREFIENLNW